MSTFTYDSVDKMAVMVKVTPKSDFSGFDAEIQPDTDAAKKNILGAIGKFMADRPADLSTAPIVLGGSSSQSSKGGKSKKNRKSKKARKYLFGR